MYINRIIGGIAHLVERRSLKPTAACSSHVTLTTLFLALALTLPMQSWAKAPHGQPAKAEPAKSTLSKKPALKAKSSSSSAKSPKAFSGKAGLSAKPKNKLKDKPILQPTIKLERAPSPIRNEFGCVLADGSLAPVGKTVTISGKHLRCQQTYDLESAKLKATPGWVELFMPSATLGAGLRETRVPEDAEPIEIPFVKTKLDDRLRIAEQEELAATAEEKATSRPQDDLFPSSSPFSLRRF